MGEVAGKFRDLRFRKEQLIFTDAQYKEIATDFWPWVQPPKALTDIDRAFIQAMLMVAVSKSEQAGILWETFAAFVTAAPSRSVIALARSMASSRLRREFRKYVDDDPKYSAAGKGGITYGLSLVGKAWLFRVKQNDLGYLDDFRAKAG